MKMQENRWTPFLKEEFKKEYFLTLSEFLKVEYATKKIYPKKEHVFNAFAFTPYDDVKVVILGQDPYHQPHQAHGLCFSVNKGIDIPPSLKNIYKELNEDLGCTIPTHGCLVDWARQGVFLLNTTLTVEESKPNSHFKKGWETFTDTAIQKLNEKTTPVVFILWGRNARNKKTLITNPAHLILESAHPSPLSAYQGFFGSKPFSRCNEFLAAHGLAPIDWQIKG